MNKRIRLFVLPIITLLSSCSINDLIGIKTYSGYEEYLKNDLNCTKYEDVASLNDAIKSSAYQWTSGRSDSSKYSYYYTSHNLMVLAYDDYTYSISSTEGLTLLVGKRSNCIAYCYGATSTPDLYLREDGSVTTSGGAIASDEYKKDFNAYIYDNNGGYLFVLNGKHLIFLNGDKSEFYVSENYTSTFTGPNKTTRVVPTCDLLTNTLEALTFTTLALPNPGGDKFEAWGREVTYKDTFSNYTVYLAGVDPLEYIPVLEANGFTVIRSSDDIIFLPFYGERAGSWLIHDEKGELKGALSFQDYLYTSPKGETFGPKFNTQISFYKARSGYVDGRELTTRTDWTDSEKTTMRNWYDGSFNTVIPFHKLKNGYNVPTSLSRASEDLFGGALMIGQECYKIWDESIDYYLDGYAETLEANGYHKFVPSYDLSTAEGLRAFKNSDESKYYECYINEEADVAIKFSFSFNDGNVIKVFKKSLMHSHLDDEM